MCCGFYILVKQQYPTLGGNLKLFGFDHVHCLNGKLETGINDEFSENIQSHP